MQEKGSMYCYVCRRQELQVRKYAGKTAGCQSICKELPVVGKV